MVISRGVMHDGLIHTPLLSFGMSGEVFHAPLLAAHSKFKLAKIVDRKSDRARNRYPDVTVTRQVDDVFKDDAIELVVVNTPNETHHAFVKAALEAGKHVIVEKPLTVTAQEADDLIALAAKNKKVLSVFQNRRWDGGFLTLQNILAQGLVGRVAEFEVHYDRYRNYIEPNTWKEVAAPGTGILYNLGSHLIDQVLVLFGKPLQVDARIGAQRTGGVVDDFYDLRFQYRDFLAIIKSSYLVKEPGPQYILHGVDGSFVKFGIDPQEQALKDGKVPGDAGWGIEDQSLWGTLNITGGRKKIETIAGDYLLFYENIFLAIRNSHPLAVKAEDAREVIRIIEACYESNKQHRAIEV